MSFEKLLGRFQAAFVAPFQLLKKAAMPDGRVKLGSLLAAIGREDGLTDEDAETFATLRDNTRAEPMSFE